MSIAGRRNSGYMICNLQYTRYVRNSRSCIHVVAPDPLRCSKTLIAALSSIHV